MTISDTTSRWERTGDGNTTDFTFTNKVVTSAGLKVYIDGAVQASGYTVSGIGDEGGGTVSFDTAPDDQAAILLLRDEPTLQASDFPLGGGFPTATVEDAFDKITIIAQQLQEEIDRCLKYSSTDSSLPAATIGALSSMLGKVLQFDATTGAPTLVDLADLTATGVTGATGGIEISGTNLQLKLDGGSLKTDSDGVAGNIPYVLKTGAYALVNPTDRGRMIACTGTWALTLTELSSLGETNFHFFIANISTGTITLTAAGSDKINNNQTTWAVRPYQAMLVVGDMSAAKWTTVGHVSFDADNDTYFQSPTDDTLLGKVGGTEWLNVTASAVQLGSDGAIPIDLLDVLKRAGTTCDVAVLLDETTIATPTSAFTQTWDNSKQYHKIEIIVSRARPDTGDDTLILRTSTNGGSSYDSGVSDYGWAANRIGGGSNNAENDNADSEIHLTGASGTIESTDGNCGGFKITILDPGNANCNTTILFEGFWIGGSANYNAIHGGGQRLAEQDTDGVQLLFATQNIAEMQVRILGYLE